MLQLLKLIAIELSDKDLCSFSLAYRTFHDAVGGDQVVWRSRLLRDYDAPAKGRKNAYDWRRTYQARKRVLQEFRQIEFEAGTSEKEQIALEVLQDLLLGLFTHISRYHIPLYISQKSLLRFPSANGYPKMPTAASPLMRKPSKAITLITSMLPVLHSAFPSPASTTLPTRSSRQLAFSSHLSPISPMQKSSTDYMQ